MKESTRNEIIRLHYGGASQRRIAKLLGVARKSVAGVLVGHQQHFFDSAVGGPRRVEHQEPLLDPGLEVDSDRTHVAHDLPR